MSGWEVFQLWLMAFLTLALFSFLYRDNPIYKVVEHVYAGITVGYQIGLIWNSIILQQVWAEVLAEHWWRLIPAGLGLLMLCRLSSRLSWLSRTSLAFVMGTTAGIALIAELHGSVLPQMQDTMVPLNGGDGFGATLLSIVVVVGVLSTLVYFYFSKEHKGALGATAKVGVWFIMISFGAHFGYTVMGRVSLLIGRVQFLIEDWIGSFL